MAEALSVSMGDQPRERVEDHFDSFGVPKFVHDLDVFLSHRIAVIMLGLGSVSKVTGSRVEVASDNVPGDSATRQVVNGT